MSRLSRLFPRAERIYMTPEELAASRKALEMTQAQFADELHLVRYEVEELESGARSVPSEVAYQVRVALVERERERVAAACTLPVCEERARLHTRVERAQRKLAERGVLVDPDAVAEDFNLRYTTTAVAEHEKACAICRMRDRYVEQHAPPMPPPPVVLFETNGPRILGPLAALAKRLPAFMQPPPGEAGAGRRAAATYTTMFAMIGVLIVGGNVWESLERGMFTSALSQLARFGLALPVLLVSSAMGGALYDAVRRQRHRFAGYVMRGGLLAPYVVGAGLLFFSFIGRESSGFHKPALAAAIVGVVAVVGVFAGAVAWMVDRLRGRLQSSN